jgi:PAS domain S-box-containing protein
VRSAAAFRLLAEASASLSESLEWDEVVTRIGSVAVPRFADWSVVDALEGGVLRPIAWTHVDPVKVPRVAELHRRYAIDASVAQPQAEVLRTNKPLLVADVTEEMLRSSARDEAHLSLLRELDPRSLIVVPLVTRGRSAGVVTFVSCQAARRYDASDVALAEELVRRFGLAMENARLHRDLKMALRQRQERDRQLRMVFRHMPGTVWAVDRELRVTYATGRLLNVAGVDARALVGTTVYDFLGIRDPVDPVIAHHFAALRGETSSFDYAFRDRWYAVLIEALRDDAGRIVGCVGAAFDVTEKRQVAQRLALSERRLSEAQRVAHVGSFEWEIQPNVLTWSDELQRIYGFEPGQFGGTFEAFMQRVPAGEIDATRKVIFDAYARLSPFTYDHSIVRTDGSVRVLHSRGDIIRDEQGRPVRMAGTCWDVTEQRELTRSLEQAVSRWQATVNATAEGILVVDLEGKVTAVNERFGALWRLGNGARNGNRDHLESLRRAIEDVEDPEAFRHRIAEIYSRQDQESFDVIRFKDGRVFECNSIPQRIGEHVSGRVWSIRDVTERERLLNRAVFLADATRLLASLEVEHALDAVAHLAVPYLGDGCAIDLFGNGGPRRLIAVSRSAAMPISPEVHPSVLASSSAVYEVASRSYVGVPLVVKGQLIGAITLAAPPHRKYSPSDLELAEELARRAALAIDNARLYRHAREALQTRDEFLALAAHEIRGPINSLHLAVQAMHQGSVPSESLPRLFDVVERQDRRLGQFVGELLDLGRIRTGRLQFEYQMVNLGDVVREVAASLGAELARSGSSLTVTTPGAIRGEWDKARIHQIVFNLLSNAVKFGLGKPIELAVAARGGRARLTVRDHGMGMSGDVQSRLFKPFERGVSARHYGGLGLGLHIVKTIVDALGGNLTVDSMPGQGSTFTVELPLARERMADANPHC